MSTTGLIIFIVIVVIILIIFLFVGLGSKQSVPNGGNGNFSGGNGNGGNGNGNGGNGNGGNGNGGNGNGNSGLQFMAVKPQKYDQYHDMRAQLTNWQLSPNTVNNGFVDKSGVYNVPNDCKMALWGRVNLPNDVPMKNDKLLPQLGLLKNGEMINSVNLPVKVVGDKCFVPAGKYNVDTTQDLKKGDKVTFNVAGRRSDIENIMKECLGDVDTSFGGVRR
jgi:hypothetical protein